MLGIPESPYSLIIIGGKAPNSFSMPSIGYKKIVAADSGFDIALGLGISPDFVVGDFDSTEKRDLIDGFLHKSAIKDKDESDFELALMEIDGPYDLIGGGEGRLDHLIAIMSLFYKYGVPRLWFTREDVIIGVNSGIEMDLPHDSTISIFALNEARVYSRGLVWELGDRKLDRCFMSLSNRNKDSKVKISTDSPILIRVNSDVFPKMSLMWTSLAEDIS